MPRLILVRHGQSQWNLENRFTGWWDVDLTDKGEDEARAAGQLLAEKGMLPDARLHLVPDPRDPHAAFRAGGCRAAVDPRNQGLAAERAPLWRADRARQGRDRGQARRRPGQDLAPQLRHSAAAAGSGLASSIWRSDPRYAGIADPRDREPEGHHRPRAALLRRRDRCRALKAGETVLVSAHGNSLRALVKHLSGISDAEITGLEIPTGQPIVYELDDDLAALERYYLSER